ncbi:Yip1 family protein [Saccharicrinis sp. FJH54]|uniref:Yip1 family protein n=1 Tax=Saccharicrinis sp. FJH54 TaxID=3344665 RepID=UPI0035D4D2E4
MSYKTLFNRLKNLIISPSAEWKEIDKEELSGLNAVHQFALPLIALSAIAAFIGTAIYLEGFNVEESLKKALLVFVSLFSSIYVSMGAIYFLMPKFNLSQDRNKVFRFVAYASAVIFAIKFITELIPELFFLKILNLYTAFIVWEGVTPIFEVNEKDKASFVVFCSFVIIAGNYAVFSLLRILMPGF